MGIEQALLVQNWIAGWGGLAVFLAFYFIRVPKEERMMLDHFGEAYREYSARTGRILPKL
jgi:protein-S-isoprenylcysteine O-methyltransferase Ste14